MTARHRTRSLVALAALLAAVACDQATKWLILEAVMQPPRVIALSPFLNVTLGFNTGVSFGLFRDVFDEVPWLLAGVKVLIVVGLVVWAANAARVAETLGLGLMAGGALGNVIDQARQGAVTDFLDLHAGGWHWPTFNMADVAIGIGAFLLISTGLFARNRPAAAPQPS